MFSQTQMDAYAEILADDPNVFPPRIVTIPRDELAQYGDDVDAYGDGALLFVGRDANDRVDCGGECGHDHTEYIVIRADGAGSPPVVSHTMFEMLFGPPALWDDARAVEPTDWPNA